jgi:hypothetical protein
MREHNNNKKTPAESGVAGAQGLHGAWGSAMQVTPVEGVSTGLKKVLGFYHGS